MAAARTKPIAQSWLLARPRFDVHFTPISASWLNQVERWFATLTERCIRRGTHRSTQALKKSILAYVELNKQEPRPFSWIKTADEILASIERFVFELLDQDTSGRLLGDR